MISCIQPSLIGGGCDRASFLLAPRVQNSVDLRSVHTSVISRSLHGNTSGTPSVGLFRASNCIYICVCEIEVDIDTRASEEKCHVRLTTENRGFFFSLRLLILT